MGLVYLESGRHTWLWLIINPIEATFLSDAIVHDGIVYVVDAQIGCLYSLQKKDTSVTFWAERNFFLSYL